MLLRQLSSGTSEEHFAVLGSTGVGC